LLGVLRKCYLAILYYNQFRNVGLDEGKKLNDENFKEYFLWNIDLGITKIEESKRLKFCIS